MEYTYIKNQLQRISPYYFILNDVKEFEWIDINGI
ncbi:hypothetical protein M140OLGA_0546 [Staphylococcus aureus subsp. aureus 112808A]|nr:hypothetical protein M140OLGA_0546 [Staphylococcus aureus subsp. aureus 112808A]